MYSKIYCFDSFNFIYLYSTFRKKFVCHHSSFMKVPAEKNTRSFTKNSSCLATINIKVKLETAFTKKKDPFIQVSKVNTRFKFNTMFPK